MSKVHPTTRTRPSKPYAEFPLFPHATGRWCKKIRGKLHYFGPWDDPDGALAKYEEQKQALHEGRTPRPDPDAVTVKDLANEFLNHKQRFVESGELSPLTFADYKRACDAIVSFFGKQRIVTDIRPHDFAGLREKLAQNNGFYRLGNTIQRIRSIFKFAYDQELIERTVRYGQGFARPRKDTIRKHRAKQGKKLFSALEIHKLLNAASIPMRAMILLGINAGFGNSDAGNLPRSALDLDRGWLDYPRPKTGIPRRCPLWPDTVVAIKEAFVNRPTPKDEADANLVFITQRGSSWAKDIADSPITKEMRKLLNSLGIDGRRNFYTLRHTFRTVADESRDQPAVDHIMGHEVPNMASVYRERISDERLRAVTDHVHAWLFGVN
jgi:integrase